MIKRALWMVFGSVAVSAACAASRGIDEAGPVGQAVDAAADVVKDVLGIDTAMSDASAAPPDTTAPPLPAPPTVDGASCDKSDGVFWYAERAYPGKSDIELALVRAIVCGTPSTPAGFCSVSPTYVRDGAVAVVCGASGWKATSVRFVTP